ncbi:DNA-3-methyladenine glycosylase 2 [Sphingosinicella sp. CPCC 101087]|uniref:DNA-3-methyladenine glycosylase 2 n=1 Tax=Sphingosinicella sp. CPCC 101087 TaxID=2497754 RepID=UPI001FB0AD1D|nr:AlkA N-terminal domain-containing protein [Sphingosinicella sp. CPCC 101087]
MWRGTLNTVSRALALIEEGALDDGSVDDLAERLGVGERQLRRLFRTHVGASPVSVAQTRRVLLAKQLIHESRLSMTEVAFASGFSSVRRFNETFQGLFKRPPTALRRDGMRRTPVAQDDLTVLLRYRPPYDWPTVVDFLRARAISGIETVTSKRYARTFDVDGSQGIVVVEPTNTNALRVSVRFAKVSSLPRVIARVRRLFDLAADPEAISTHLASDPALEPLVASRPGLRVPGGWDAFEVATRAILGQQITLQGARRLLENLVAEYGAALAPDLRSEGLTHVFPRADVLAQADLSHLRVPQIRAAALSSLAASLVSDPQFLTAGPDLASFVRRLRTSRGIGEWTAQYIAMRELRETDAFPPGDTGLRRTMGNLEGRDLSSNELLERAERWRPWRAYAAQHLWASRLPAKAC